MKDPDQIFQEGRAISDLIGSDGWKVLEKKIQVEIEVEIDALREIEIEKRGLQEIAAEYIIHREKLSGLKRVFEIIQEILVEKNKEK